MIRTFDPKEVSVIFGPYIITGFSETKCSVSRAEDAFSLVVGCDGESTRVRNYNRSGTVTLNLQQSSPSNDVLSGIALADEATNAGLMPLLIKDNNGSTLIEATTAYIQKIPDADFGKDASERAWTIMTDNLVVFLGGNE